MPSLLHGIAVPFLRLTRKHRWASAAGLHAAIAKAHEPAPPPEGAVRDDSLGFPVYTVTAGSGGRSRRLLYLHGGGYVFEIAKQHWTLITQLAERLDATVTVPLYPKAPAHTWRDSLPSLGSLVTESVTVMGDSAGGGLALALVHQAIAAGVVPRRVVLIAPFLDATVSSPESVRIDRIDPWLGVDGGREAGRLWAGNDDPARLEVSPLFADQTNLPPTLVFVGSRDCLAPQARDFAERGGPVVELVDQPDLVHVYPLLPIPEARPAIDRIVAFIGT
ncbi:alpha/beta hydrolase fold domain-containing protein [Tenggerimyces flavus]|uniref:Alpha/beta hydrolase fold domain-containing protein n=1 Tax=Tenggerimyces flavus TaxID=1708749 RepID=A0ABV7YJ62_9ACTN|nr:alpha/beta hydrolase [Tenggerimyces flavus]MBM7786805.1 acetyl esterase/lipase [Tenggerimyces flavus]